MTVYIITAGEYSDYHICAVFSTREQAEAALPIFTSNYDYEWPEINEWKVDDISRYPPGFLPFTITMDNEGNTEQVERISATSFEHLLNGVMLPGSRCLFRIWARDEEHAVKIANEKRAQMIASGEWK